jgi:hypothetical protein
MDLDQDFTVIEKAGFCIVLCSRDEPYPLSQDADLFTSKSANLLVYAESIEISSSIKLPRRTLGLFCQDLTLSGSEDVTIDVSGANGGPATAATVGSGRKGEDGKDAGSVYISVENPAADLTRLKVRALGGDGGPGASTSDSNKTAQGGQGGKGGSAGKLRKARPVYVRSTSARQSDVVVQQQDPRCEVGIPAHPESSQVCIVAGQVLSH